MQVAFATGTVKMKSTGLRRIKCGHKLVHNGDLDQKKVAWYWGRGIKCGKRKRIPKTRESREIKMTWPIGGIERDVHFSERGGSSGPRAEGDGHNPLKQLSVCRTHYASVGGAPEACGVVACVCVCVLTLISRRALKTKCWKLLSKHNVVFSVRQFD